MVITVSSVFGNWRTGRVARPCRPSSRISRLTTEASTGRRMKIEVKFMTPPFPAVLGSGLWRAGGGDRVVDYHPETVLQLELAGGDDLVAGLNAFDDLSDVALALADPDEDLLDRQL